MVERGARGTWRSRRGLCIMHIPSSFCLLSIRTLCCLRPRSRCCLVPLRCRPPRITAHHRRPPGDCDRRISLPGSPPTTPVHLLIRTNRRRAAVCCAERPAATPGLPVPRYTCTCASHQPFPRERHRHPALPPPRPSACAFPAPSSPRGAPACVPPAHQARHQASWLHHFVRVTTMHSRSFFSTDCWRTSTAAGPTRAARRAPSSWGATIVPRSRGCVRRRLNHHGRRERLFGELDRLGRCQSRLSGRGANSLNVARHFSTHGELDRLGGEVQHGTVTKNRFVLRSCSGDFSRLPTVLNRIRWCL